MSDLFLQNSLNNIFDTVTEANNELPQWINIIDIKKNDNIKGVSKINNHVTSSVFMTQDGGAKSRSKKNRNNSIDSATSSAFMGQLGGAVDSATSSIFMEQSGSVDTATSSAFMGQFGGAVDSATSSAFMGQFSGTADSATSSMFMGQYGGAADSATSSMFMGQFGGATDSATSSAFMGQFGGSNSNKDINKLVSMLTSESNNENGLSETTTETLEAQLRDILKQNGGSNKHKQVKAQCGGSNLNVNDINNFFTNLKSQGVDVNVKLNNKTLSEFFDLAQNTTTEISEININNIIGGATKGKKKSFKYSESSELLDGGTNAGFQAFLDFKKHVANKLKISNGPIAAKIAGSVNTEMKKKYSELSAVEIAKKNAEHFDKNMDKIKSEFKELIEKSNKK